MNKLKKSVFRRGVLISMTGLLSLTYLLSACKGTPSYYLRKDLKFSTVKHVLCNADTTQSYQVYLPTAYTKDKKWPVVFMFDSHGSGQMAVEHAMAAAERYNFILIGSNNSKNNVPNLDYIVGKRI